MANVSLAKGGNVSLTKICAEAGVSLGSVVVGCGWDARKKLFRSQANYDLDLSAAGLNGDGKVPSHDDPSDPGYQEWFIYPNHRYPQNRCIRYMGDNRTGKGEGDDEQIEVDLTEVPDYITRIIFAPVIWLAEKRKQKYGDISNAFIRIFDKKSGLELARYDLGADFKDETLVMFGELYRHSKEWKFRAIGQGYGARAFRDEFEIRHPFEVECARFD